MARLIDTIGRGRSAPGELKRFTFDDLFAAMGNGGFGSPRPPTTWGDENSEPIGNSFEGYVQAGYQANGVIFAVILARMMLFTEARFLWQHKSDGRPGELHYTPALDILDTPWRNATTGTLLAHMEQDVSMAGNSYTARRGNRLVRLRPDRVDIVIGSPSDTVDDIDAEVIGYRYWRDKFRQGPSEFLFPEHVAHFAPIPDPIARFRGMSWMQPVIDEIQADSGYTRHKGKFIENAATPNLAVTMPSITEKKDFLEIVAELDRRHKGANNAYKTMWTMGGGDVSVIGADMKQMDFKNTQGAGETRIAAAGGVPPVIVGLSEGLAQATYSNYGQARRKFADGWARPQWRAAAGALQSILPVPSGSRLWYDDRDISFLQEDQKDDAEIKGRDAQTIRTYVDAGYKPESVVAAVQSGDLTKLEHSGLYSVQLQKPESGTPTPAAG